MASQGSKGKARAWLARHQRTIREWMILVAAVTAGIAGWQQIADERDARKDAEQDAGVAERREQADEIGAWLGPPPRDDGMNVILSNHSHQPVYQAVVSRVTIQANGPRTGREISGNLRYQDQRALSVVPPGEHSIHFGPGFGGMSRSPGFEIAFRDQAGNNWVRYSNGLLRELDESTISFYDLSIPVYWQIPERVK